MEIETVFEGVHPDRMKYRVRRIDDMYYYAVQYHGTFEDGSNGWVWHTVDRNPSKFAIIGRVQADFVAKQQRIDDLKERGLI